MSPLDDELYRRLEVGPHASRHEIVQAYRRLAHGAHPDAHPEDPDASRRFRELTEAYDVLADPSRRASYDCAHLGAAAPGGSSPSAASGPPVVAAPGPVFVGAAPLWAGPVRIDPAPGLRPVPSPDEPKSLGAVVERLLSRLLDERWRW